MGSEKQLRKTPLGIEKQFDRFEDWLDESWVLRKAAPVFNRYPKILILLTWLIRIAVGSVFLVSGLSKGIDPWGTYYKMVEYLNAMHIPVWEWGNAVLVLAFILFSVEFFTGVAIMTGCFRKAAPILAALFMIVMLPLTLWIAIADPVADCGCFGDFLVISNWSTFIKNCILSLAVVWLLKFNRKARALITPYLQWLMAVAVSAYIISVGYIGYWQQPMIDFRPFPVGTALFADEEGPEYSPVYEFIYEKDGVEKTFSEEDVLPEESEGWKFKKREVKSYVKNEFSGSKGKPGGADFRVWSEDGSEDVTEMLTGYSRQLILLVPDINRLSMADSWKINMLYDKSKADDTEFFAVVAGSPEAIEEWRDHSSGQYDIYTSEDTSIKELARGNPSLVSLEDGVVKWKTALSALVFDDEIENATIESSPLEMGKSGPVALADLSLILLSFLAALSLISMLQPYFSIPPTPKSE